MVMRIRQGRFPHLEVNPFEEYNDWFSSDVMQEPLTAAPEPKRRFVPSKWEAKRVVKLVRALRRGWLKKKDDAAKSKETPLYLMWGDDNQVSDKTASGLTYIPPPKPKLPGHEESYRPPAEYIPEDGEGDDEENEREFVPQSFSSLRAVPSYGKFLHDRFERCLDLYLCPRVRRHRVYMDPEDLKPRLPSPSDLEPFPKYLCLRFRGHTSRATSVACDPTGQFLASGSADGSGERGCVVLYPCRDTRCDTRGNSAATRRALATHRGHPRHFCSAPVGGGNRPVSEGLGPNGPRLQHHVPAPVLRPGSRRCCWSHRVRLPRLHLRQ